MSRSYYQKLATYRAYMQANPGQSNTAIYKHYQGSSNGMRKTDFLKALKPLREVIEYDKRNLNSDMRLETRKKLHKAAYRVARSQTERGKKEYRGKLSKKQKIKYDARGIHPTVADLVANTYSNHPNASSEDYVTFYKADEGYEVYA